MEELRSPHNEETSVQEAHVCAGQKLGAGAVSQFVLPSSQQRSTALASAPHSWITAKQTVSSCGQRGSGSRSACTAAAGHLLPQILGAISDHCAHASDIFYLKLLVHFLLCTQVLVAWFVISVESNFKLFVAVHWLSTAVCTG